MADPRIILRDGWNARPPLHPFTRMPVTPIGNLYHHTTGATLAAELDPSDDDYYLRWARSIQRFHQDTRGWIDIAYNFLVTPRGEILEGRGWGIVGAHAGRNTLGHNNVSNNNTHGIAYFGDSNQPGVLTQAGEHALRWLLDQAAFRYGPGTQNHWGHRDVHPTDCPGDPLYAWQADGLPDGPPTIPPPPPVPGDPQPPNTHPAPPQGWEEALVLTLPTLSYGSHGQAVRNAQALLVARGYNLYADGSFGDKTRTQVQRFQTNMSVPGGADGVVGHHTWTALLTS